ncbi:MAG: HAD-IC family P-type ATPase [Candidatus Ancillula sp.]|nr:HAD-IC family P-type ATPase [Candidatus Ancillula sp.]
MDTLIALGSGVSFFYSLFSLFFNTGHIYFETSGVILTVVQVGKLLESRTKNQASKTIKSLIDLSPKIAYTIVSGKTFEKPINEVKIGDIVLIRPGDRIPIDGEIKSTNKKNILIDESVLTGESAPLSKTAGDQVLAGTLNLGSDFIIKVTKLNQDTIFSQIINMVTNSIGSKPPIQRIADQVSKIFVPAVLLISLLSGFLWFFLPSDSKYNLTFAIMISVAVLVVSCPCALGLATPTAITVASGRAAKNGILFKSTAMLELLGKVNTIVFDKTGTLTQGRVMTYGEKDKLRPESISAISKLDQLGIKIILASGDNEKIVNEIAKDLNLSHYYSSLLPQDKFNIIKREQEQNNIVAFVGDGINDAPALSSADIGVTLRSATDVALDSADVIIMNNNLMDLVKSINISKLTLKRIKQNLFLSLIYNICLIPIAAGLLFAFGGPLLNPMLASIAMSLSSICVVLNSLR